MSDAGLISGLDNLQAPIETAFESSDCICCGHGISSARQIELPGAVLCTVCATGVCVWCAGVDLDGVER